MNLTDHSRHIAGHTALRIAANLGADLAAEYYKGVLAAFAVALVALIGPERTHEVFADAVGRFVPQRTKPRLVSRDGERVA